MARHQRFTTLLAGVLATLLGCALLAQTTAPGGRAPSPPGAVRNIPRAADGKPDLSGIWITGALQLLIGEEEANAIRQADAAAGRQPPPRPEPPPYKPEAEARRQAYLARRQDQSQRRLLAALRHLALARTLLGHRTPAGTAGPRLAEGTSLPGAATA